MTRSSDLAGKNPCRQGRRTSHTAGVAMFHAITWQPKAKKLHTKPPTVLTRGVEFGLVQRPGTARFHRTAARLHGAFEALRCEVSSNV